MFTPLYEVESQEGKGKNKCRNMFAKFAVMFTIQRKEILTMV